VIRRFYVLPLNPEVTTEEAADFVAAFDSADLFIPGVLESCAAVDLDSPTVVWEMTFPDEATYTGPYMTHPYHVGTLDTYLLGDSPERRSHDFGTARYSLAERSRILEEGIRRIVLANIPEDVDVSAVEKLAARADGAVSSTFAADDVGWRSVKGLNWTHVLEQGFTDIAALERYLRTPDGIATSTRDGFRTLGVKARAVRVLTYPFKLKPVEVAPPDPPVDAPVLYTMTARTDPGDIEAFIKLLIRDYDPALARVGAQLVHRWRTCDHGYRNPEVQSTWRLPSFAAFVDFRGLSTAGDDPSFNRFVLEGMPLVKGGTRRFYREL
jgi:hypothetical protein